MLQLQLSDGTSMPALGLGTWLSEPGEVARAVEHAIAVGYRHIDCAWIYLNEEEVGRGIANAGIPREELWVTTKLWNDAHEPQDVRPALERSLKLLGLDYVDLYLMHWPVALRSGVARPRGPEDFRSLDEMPLETTWEAMAALPSSELTKRVGVSNFSLSKIDRISDAVGVVPVVNQVELHPYNQQNPLLAGMRERSIVGTAYSPLGSAGRPAVLRREGETSLLADSTLAAIAEARGATPAQVLIAWAMARGTAVIPKSTNPDRIEANLKAANLELAPTDMEKLAALDEGARYVTGEFWCPPGSPYSVESLWG